MSSPSLTRVFPDAPMLTAADVALRSLYWPWLVEVDGGYRLYYSTDHDPGPGGIGVLTGPGPLSPWTGTVVDESMPTSRPLHGDELHYVTARSGPVLAGCWGTRQSWAHLMSVLAQDFTLIAPDLLGQGESAKPLGGYSLGPAGTLRDLMETVVSPDASW